MVLFYDHLLLFDAEVQFIVIYWWFIMPDWYPSYYVQVQHVWAAQRSWLKLLFLINRYGAPICIVINIYSMAHLLGL